MVVIFLGGGVLTVSRVRSDAEAALTASHAQVAQRVDGAVDLLESPGQPAGFTTPRFRPSTR